ncbi:phosphate ABC transporter substrate-binding/OmpA family protein [Yoonia sp. 2307UL14-13]|uniref:phosphate ABC transporter substrate-binding/OmpA family protein n=1 Tax=Yoonia sp. 2307UL14-13 TaxID=3126506 RepID=UPI003094C133
MALLGATALATSLAADPVILRSTDGTTNLNGDLIGFDGEYYLLNTELGDLRVAADRVTCDGAGCPTVETVSADTIAGGSDTVAEGLMPLLLAGFATDLGAEAQTQTGQGEGRIVTTFVGQDGFGAQIGAVAVQSGTSDDAFGGLLDRSFQMGLSARRITPAEAQALAADGAGTMIAPDQEHIVAIDSLVIVVNQSNPTDALSVADLAGIFAGQITNWAQVGGPDLPITVVTTQDAGTNDVLRAGIFGDQSGTRLVGNYTATDNVDAAIYVDENPGAIAYVGFAFKRGQKPLNLVSECGIGTSPDAFSVKTEEYTLFRRLYLYTRADTDNTLTDDFVRYATSPAANLVILQSGFIDLSVEQVPLGTDSPRAARVRGTGQGSFEKSVVDRLIGEMASHGRLSSTFRFRTGSTELDPRGIDDLQRLADYLADLPDGAEITFAGFADSVGAFEPNVILSEGRAEQVRSALLALAGDRLNNVTIKTAGYGEIDPAACNTNDAGRAINRRVETWIKTQ